MNDFEIDYRNLISNIWEFGTKTKNRTKVGTKVAFNQGFNIDLRKGFPIITGKKIFFDKAYAEFNWMIQGMHTTNYLNKNGITWWNEYADANGDLGHTYGHQIRDFGGGLHKDLQGIDQLELAIHELRYNSRRAVVSFWNPHDMSKTPLPPCYTSMTFVRINDSLNMQMVIRSSDTFLGLPYDIVIGALFLIRIAEHLELTPCFLGLSLANAHMYLNHKHAYNTYMKSEMFRLPKFHEGILRRYTHGDYIKAKMNN